MNLEGLTLKLVTDNLIKQLEGGKIYKIFMPTPNSLLLMVRRDRDTLTLLADMNGGSPALYFPTKLPENPEDLLLCACSYANTWKKGALRKSPKADLTA